MATLICIEGTTLAQEADTTRASFDEYWCRRGGEQWVVEDKGKILGAFTLKPNQPVAVRTSRPPRTRRDIGSN
jgi:hypothetical protein